ncbi:MAG: choice-of-anchor R domain-containing protein [Gemmataceae bacterium]
MLARLLLTGGLLATLPAAGPAALIIGSYPATNDAAGVAVTPGGAKTFSFATAFTMTGDYDLSSATARLGVTGSGVGLTGRIFGDAGGNPGTPLIALTSPAVAAGGLDDLVFAAAGPAPLTAGSTYWLVLTLTTPATGGSLRWAGGGLFVTPTGPGAVHAYGFRYSGNAAWRGGVDILRLTYQLDGTPAAPAGPTPSGLALRGLAAPAPAGLVLLGLGLPALGLVRRRKLA